MAADEVTRNTTAENQAAGAVEISVDFRARAARGVRAAFTLRTIGNNVAFLALGSLVLVFWIFGGSKFMSLRNWELMLEQLPVVAMLAMGLTFVITAGYIDLSVGSALGLAGYVGALSVNRYGPIGLAICVVIGLGIGVFNGLVFAFLRIPSFVATLATQVIVRAFVYMVSGGFAIFVGVEASGLNWLTTMGQFPVVVLLLAGVAVILWLIYNKTVFGQNLKAIGGNESVAALFGVSIPMHKILCFGLMGLVVGLASIVNLSQFQSAGPTSGLGLELLGIASVVLGGTPLTGARGSVLKSVIGALALVVLADGLTLAHVPTEWDDVARGCLLIIAIAIALERKKIGVVK